jgi:hypothetical protein
LTIDDCIKNPDFKLFKLHGSVNWGRRLKAPFDTSDPDHSLQTVIGELIQNADRLNLSSDFEMVSEPKRRLFPPEKYNVVPLFPAIAIPVMTKLNYECPDDHLSCLKNLLPQARTILSIGWRGMEKHFLKMLAESLAKNPPIDTYAVAGNSSAAKQVLGQFGDAGISIKGRRYDKGFTEFVQSRQAEIFCGKEVRLQISEEEVTSGFVSEPVSDSTFDPRSGGSDFDPRFDKDE